MERTFRFLETKSGGKRMIVFDFLLGFIIIITSLIIIYYIYELFAFCGNMIFHIGYKEKFANCFMFILLLGFVAAILWGSVKLGGLILG
jgi:hypothetical protein